MPLNLSTPFRMGTAMKKNKIAKYASMASRELHEEYMNLDYNLNPWYIKDIMSEVIDKLDNIEAMANKKWWKK
jgi:hypothetical protein